MSNAVSISLFMIHLITILCQFVLGLWIHVRLKKSSIQTDSLQASHELDEAWVQIWYACVLITLVSGILWLDFHVMYLRWVWSWIYFACLLGGWATVEWQLIRNRVRPNEDHL